MNELVHFSREPLTELRDSEPFPLGAYASFKPNGLWVSVGEEWAEWCVENGFHADAIRYATRVSIRESANVLRIASAAELDNFTHHYGERDVESIRYASRVIDWPRVQREYDGIIIAPYQWTRRLDLMWYYSWDVASGCIWRAQAATLGPSLSIADCAEKIA